MTRRRCSELALVWLVVFMLARLCRREDIITRRCNAPVVRLGEQGRPLGLAPTAEPGGPAAVSTAAKQRAGRMMPPTSDRRVVV